MPLVELRDVRQHYRQGDTVVKALDGVSLGIEVGEFVAVVGRSGSGKTTMLDLMGLLMRPSAGSVLVDGADAGGMDDGGRADLRGRRLGFIFQEFNLLPTLTALENVMLPRRYVRVEGDARARATELLEQVGLGSRARHHPHQLSGGEQQRVAVARALINRPALVLGDEPTGELDSDTAGELLALLRSLNATEGITFVLVTHDQELAARTDRVIHLRDGRILDDKRTA